jgi:peroxiredoxin Q/BCP
MNKQLVFWIGLLLTHSVLLAACSGSTPTPRTEEPESAVSAVAKEPEPTESEAAQEPETTEVVVIEKPEATENVATQELEPTEIPSTEEPETGRMVGETAPDFTLPDGEGNMVSLAGKLQEFEHIVVVFYYRDACQPCMAQLSEIENDHAKYEDKGSQVIAIAVQNEQAAARTKKISNAQFPILADSDHAVADAFGVSEYDGLSTPSVFIINKDRQIVWKEISHIDSGCGTERVPSQTILENLG